MMILAFPSTLKTIWLRENSFPAFPPEANALIMEGIMPKT